MATGKAAAASPLYVTLRYELEGSTEDCWDEAEFRRSVARAVGYDPFRADAALSVAVHVDGSSSGIGGYVEWRSREGARLGERRFVAKDGSCSKLLTEMSFAVGLQIELLRPKPKDEQSAPPGATRGAASTGTNPETATSSPPSRPSSAPGAQPRRATEGAAPDAQPRPASDAARSDFSFWVGGGPSLVWGSAPTLTGQLRLFLGVRHGNLALELGPEATLPVNDEQPDGSGFRQHLLGAGAAFCAHGGAFSGCVLFSASRLGISGLGVDQPLTPGALVLQSGARVAATLKLSERWSLAPHLDGLALLTPITVKLNGTEVWDMPPLSLLAGIAVAARFR
jgi:hypothetical protein